MPGYIRLTGTEYAAFESPYNDDLVTRLSERTLRLSFVVFAFQLIVRLFFQIWFVKAHKVAYEEAIINWVVTFIVAGYILWIGVTGVKSKNPPCNSCFGSYLGWYNGLNIWGAISTAFQTYNLTKKYVKESTDGLVHEEGLYIASIIANFIFCGLLTSVSYFGMKLMKKLENTPPIELTERELAPDQVDTIADP